MDRTALSPGARLGELEIIRVLAVGGFGIVYLARDHSLDREVAVKEFMPSLLAGRSHGQHVSVRIASEKQTYSLGLNSFMDEARLLARLSHPAIVKVYRFWKANGTGYMVMPYLRGPTLGDVRRSMSDPPTEAWLRRITDPLLDALSILHSQGFYHRYIAPDNVLVSESGQPVLLDFGAARRVMADRTQSLTAIIKPRFAPIEQYAESRLLRQGPWTDLYAFGAMVAFLLDGVPPPASTARVVHDEMETLSLRRMPNVSSGFLAAIDWALAVRPQDRPQSVTELRDALDGLTRAPQRRVEATTFLRVDTNVQAAQPVAAHQITVQLARADVTADSNLDRDEAPAVALAPAAHVAALKNERSSLGRWGWAAATAVMSAALIVGIAKLPFDGMAASLSPAVATAVVAPSTVASPSKDVLTASVQTPAADALVGYSTSRSTGDLLRPPVGDGRAPIEIRTPIEEFIEGPAEKIIEANAAPIPPNASSTRSSLAPTLIAAPATRVAEARTTIAPVASVAQNNGERASRAAARRYGPQRQAAVSRWKGPGPVEICAPRNFFFRSWCVQRRCEEPRFKGHPQCAPRTEANSMY
jgi:serine/threonine protein kinase